jgi:hypothetical protein
LVPFFANVRFLIFGRFSRLGSHHFGARLLGPPLGMVRQTLKGGALCHEKKHSIDGK